MPMVTKLGRMVTYNGGLSSTKSHDPLVTGPARLNRN